MEYPNEAKTIGSTPSVFIKAEAEDIRAAQPG